MLSTFVQVVPAAPRRTVFHTLPPADGPRTATMGIPLRRLQPSVSQASNVAAAQRHQGMHDQNYLECSQIGLRDQFHSRSREPVLEKLALHLNGRAPDHHPRGSPGQRSDGVPVQRPNARPWENLDRQREASSGGALGGVPSLHKLPEEEIVGPRDQGAGGSMRAVSDVKEKELKEEEEGEEEEEEEEDGLPAFEMFDWMRPDHPTPIQPVREAMGGGERQTPHGAQGSGQGVYQAAEPVFRGGPCAPLSHTLDTGPPQPRPQPRSMQQQPWGAPQVPDVAQRTAKRPLEVAPLLQGPASRSEGAGGRGGTLPHDCAAEVRGSIKAAMGQMSVMELFSGLSQADPWRGGATEQLPLGRGRRETAGTMSSDMRAAAAALPVSRGTSGPAAASVSAPCPLPTAPVRQPSAASGGGTLLKELLRDQDEEDIELG